jgi:iron complex outermembrane receptor protein
LSVEASLRGSDGPLRFTGNLFYSHFGNFIFQEPTGATQDELPVFQYRGGKASFYGFEAQLETRLGQALGVKWGGELQADYVRATVRNFGPAPFIPPFRILAALTGERGSFDGRLEVERAFSHDRTAPIETDAPGYTMVNASLDWHAFEANPELSLSLSANNIFDVEARRSTSQLRDFAPLGGRDIRLTARVGF